MNGVNLTLDSVLTVTEMVIYSQCVNEWCQPYLRQCTDSYRGGNTVNVLMNGVNLTLDSVLTAVNVLMNGVNLTLDSVLTVTEVIIQSMC